MFAMKLFGLCLAMIAIGVIGAWVIDMLGRNLRRQARR